MASRTRSEVGRTLSRRARAAAGPGAPQRSRALRQPTGAPSGLPVTAEAARRRRSPGPARHVRTRLFENSALEQELGLVVVDEEAQLLGQQR